MSKQTITLNKYYILIVLFLICLAFSLLLSLISIDQICEPGNGCDIVQHSGYESLFGRKNSDFGIVAFSLMLIVTFLQIKYPSRRKKQFIYLGTFIGSAIAIYFLYLQQFVIKAYCKYCLVVDICMLISLLILILTWKK